MKKLLILGAAAFITAAGYAGQFPDITIGDVKSAIADKKVTLLDANGSDSWKKGHIPGAIDFAANKDKLAQVLPKWATR